MSLDLCLEAEPLTKQARFTGTQLRALHYQGSSHLIPTTDAHAGIMSGS